MIGYVDLDTMEICSRFFLLKKHKKSKAAGVPLSAEDLSDMNAAVLDGSATGDVATGKAVILSGIYQREYRPFTADDLASQAKAALAATDQDMLRIVEDLLDVLMAKGLIAQEDLPQVVRDKLANRKAKRAALPPAKAP